MCTFLWSIGPIHTLCWHIFDRGASRRRNCSLRITTTRDPFLVTMKHANFLSTFTSSQLSLYFYIVSNKLRSLAFSKGTNKQPTYVVVLPTCTIWPASALHGKVGSARTCCLLFVVVQYQLHVIYPSCATHANRRRNACPYNGGGGGYTHPHHREENTCTHNGCGGEENA